MNASTSRFARPARSLLALACATPFLTACYVVPVHPDGRVYPPPSPSVAYPVPVAPGPAIFTARLYPSNDIAARTGIIAGSVTSPQDGKGVFSIPYNGDNLSGEATRTSTGNLHAGVANASGPRGQYVRCTYRMNSASQGTGECVFSDGARFQMHVGG